MRTRLAFICAQPYGFSAASCLFSALCKLAFGERVQAPNRLPWQAYSRPTDIFYDDTNLVSETGIQHEGPFEPALLSLGVDIVTKRLKTEFIIWSGIWTMEL